MQFLLSLGFWLDRQPNPESLRLGKSSSIEQRVGLKVQVLGFVYLVPSGSTWLLKPGTSGFAEPPAWSHAGIDNGTPNPPGS